MALQLPFESSLRYQRNPLLSLPLPSSTLTLHQHRDALLHQLLLHDAEDHDHSLYSGHHLGLAYTLIRSHTKLPLAAQLVERATASLLKRRRIISPLQGLSGALLLEHKLNPSSNARQALLELASQVHTRDEHDNDILYGKSGLLYALQQSSGSYHASQLAQGIFAYGQRHAFGIWKLGYSFGNKPYFGAAHGIVGILLQLLRDPSIWSAQQLDILQDVFRTILDCQLESGNFPTRMPKYLPLIRDSDLIQWCHGAPGVVPLMYRASKVFPDLDVESSLDRACECIWEKGLLSKGVGLCHGIAGNAYAFLYQFRFYWEKARDDSGNLHKAMQALMRARAFYEIAWENLSKLYPRPDHPLSLMLGLSGLCCFLEDLKLQLDSLPLSDAQGQVKDPSCTVFLGFPCFDDF